eukprot:1138571-Amphidinium_carterae.1
MLVAHQLCSPLCLTISRIMNVLPCDIYTTHGDHDAASFKLVVLTQHVYHDALFSTTGDAPIIANNDGNTPYANESNTCLLYTSPSPRDRG